ncbi:hypothetical protein [Haliangium ochraceum]|uniref:Uncharacterized protein n=1 Tax=Haliangium ochraceum (strain DSM 14365 / JCM 11303 / SMP-2) TaxID=502025 RepID=D0LGW3_HALO1|nr:hypothetical protein [Haliangium ochraceum]ACY14685.1 conserved hypothetical protein [Haliangium ochraceum DSM 14365]
MRLILGLIKGLIIGGLVGFGAYEMGMSGGWNWVTYGVVGALVGLLVGRPIWSHLLDKNSTVVVAVLKGVVGYGIGVGLYALVAKVWGGMDLAIEPLSESRNIYNWQFLMGAAIGGVYGAWVELDDAPAKAAADEPAA